MTDRMRVILSRVLSEELAWQAIWEAKEHYAGVETDRAEIRQEILTYMDKNGIKMDEQSYLNVRVKG